MVKKGDSVTLGGRGSPPVLFLKANSKFVFFSSPIKFLDYKSGKLQNTFLVVVSLIFFRGVKFAGNVERLPSSLSIVLKLLSEVILTTSPSSPILCLNILNSFYLGNLGKA